MSAELIDLMNRFDEIKIINEARRCEVDSSGLELPNGRDFYGLWTWKVDEYENEWPGFYNPEDCINDMINKCKNG